MKLKAKVEKVEAGKIKSIRGVVKCLKCDWYQSYISYNDKKVAVGPIRNSTCRNCLKRNRWHIQPIGKVHGNAKKYQAVTFIKMPSNSSRSELNDLASLKNYGPEVLKWKSERGIKFISGSEF